MSDPGVDYWREFWSTHARSTRDAAPQIQVLRTTNKQPIDEASFSEILALLDAHLRVSPGDEILDLCCGNGLIATHLAPRCQRVVALDFAKDLLDRIDTEQHRNIRPLVQDVRDARFEPETFDKVVVYAGLQYLSHQEVVRLVGSIHRWLREDGLCYLGDVPDASRMWRFFDSEERESAYFDALVAGLPIIGTWFDPVWLTKLARHAGFRKVEHVAHPASFPYGHFRYDLVLSR